MTCHGLESRTSAISTSDRPPTMLYKRRRNTQEIEGPAAKKPRSNGNTKPGGSSGQDTEQPNEPGVEEREGPRKLMSMVQSAIYASHKISCSFGISHTINLVLIGIRCFFY